MTYDEIFSRFYQLIDDPSFFKLPQDYAYDSMKSWLHEAVAEPYIRKIFSSIQLDDEVMVCTYTLNISIDEASDKDFVISVFAKSMVIQWMKPKVESQKNILNMIGGKEEKALRLPYKQNIERLDSMELKLRKFIRDYGYEYNSYLGGDS